MLKRPVTPDDFAELEHERLEADIAYNEALTALDRALPPPPGLPPAVPPPDQAPLSLLNDAWKIALDPPPPARGVRTRLARFVWRLVAPGFERQQAFNARLVDYLNGTAAREAAESARAAAFDAVARYSGSVAAFQAHLIVYLQQLTAYIDTKDRRAEGELIAVYDGAITGIADEMMKRWESMVAREQRFAARVAALEDLRGTVATLQQATFTVKRELERFYVPERSDTDGHAAPGAAAAAAAETAPLPSAIDSYKYVGFEDRFRGAPDEIRQRLADYLPDFRGARDVLDVGCGRGEFLDLLREAGISARGLDLNHEMVEVCRARGLRADEADALSFLRAQPDGSIGGLFAAQVVEHLEPVYLMRVLDAAYHTLRPGSRIVLETINPACWSAFFDSYIRDLTHVKPIHPETLKYLLSASGFQQVDIRFRAPYPDWAKLQPIVLPDDAPPAARAAALTLNENTNRLNALMFTYFDYAAVGTRL